MISQMKIDVVRLEPTGAPDLPAGGFSEWVEAMARALEQGTASDVPCGDCTACCQGSYFIHVTPDETGTRSRIPAALLFPAPGAPPGHQLLGFDEQGRCPMLEGSVCSIYDDRPRTCRTYDCRVFAATGVAEPGAEKAAIMARAARWRFDYPGTEAVLQQESLRVGTEFLIEHAEVLGGRVPGNATQLAMLAIRLHELFAELVARHGAPLQPVPEVLDPVLAALDDIARSRAVER